MVSVPESDSDSVSSYSELLLGFPGSKRVYQGSVSRSDISDSSEGESAEFSVTGAQKTCHEAQFSSMGPISTSKSYSSG